MSGTRISLSDRFRSCDTLPTLRRAAIEPLESRLLLSRGAALPNNAPLESEPLPIVETPVVQQLRNVIAAEADRLRQSVSHPLPSPLVEEPADLAPVFTHTVSPTATDLSLTLLATTPIIESRLVTTDVPSLVEPTSLSVDSEPAGAALSSLPYDEVLAHEITTLDNLSTAATDIRSVAGGLPSQDTPDTPILSAPTLSVSPQQTTLVKSATIDSNVSRLASADVANESFITAARLFTQRADTPAGVLATPPDLRLKETTADASDPTIEEGDRLSSIAKTVSDDRPVSKSDPKEVSRGQGDTAAAVSTAKASRTMHNRAALAVWALQGEGADEVQAQGFSPDEIPSEMAVIADGQSAPIAGSSSSAQAQSQAAEANGSSRDGGGSAPVTGDSTLPQQSHSHHSQEKQAPSGQTVLPLVPGALLLVAAGKPISRVSMAAAQVGTLAPPPQDFSAAGTTTAGHRSRSRRQSARSRNRWREEVRSKSTVASHLPKAPDDSPVHLTKTPARSKNTDSFNPNWIDLAMLANCTWSSDESTELDRTRTGLAERATIDAVTPLELAASIVGSGALARSIGWLVRRRLEDRPRVRIRALRELPLLTGTTAPATPLRDTPRIR